jgi:1-acyl-sn-glycerol-3-phosphate acyltransferase
MSLRTLRIALVTDPLAVVCVVGMGLTCSLASLLDRSGNTAHRLASFWGRALLFSSGVKMDVAGLELVPRKGGLVLVSNHQSMMDIPVLMAYLPVSFRFLAKRQLFRFPFIGWHLALGGHIRIDRTDKRAAVRALSRARKVLQANTSVLVFAEGSRSASGVQSFKAGAAHLAIKAGATVVPIGLRGTGQALPKGSVHIRPEPVRLRVGKPISTAGMSARDQKQLTERMRASVAALIA